jgi:hypothetical protein
MPHNRLKLVVPENGPAATDGATEPLVVTGTPDPELRRLRLVESEEPPFPDDAA